MSFEVYGRGVCSAPNRARVPSAPSPPPSPAARPLSLRPDSVGELCTPSTLDLSPSLGTASQPALRPRPGPASGRVSHARLLPLSLSDRRCPSLLRILRRRPASGPP